MWEVEGPALHSVQVLQVRDECISRVIEHWKPCRGLAGTRGTGVWVIVIHGVRQELPALRASVGRITEGLGSSGQESFPTLNPHGSEMRKTQPTGAGFHGDVH